MTPDIAYPLRRPNAIEFVNSKGESRFVDPTLTIQDMLAMGFYDIGFCRPEKPMEENEWRNKE